MRMRELPQGGQGDDVGESLRKALAINPQFAPATNALAQFYGMRGENLEEAHRLALQAVALEPANMYYYLTAANVLLRMRQADNAVRVCKKAMGLAKTPAELSAAQSVLESAQKYQEYLAKAKQYNEQAGAPRELESSGQAADGNRPAGEETTSRPVLQRRVENSSRTVETTATPEPAAAIHFQSDPAQRGKRDMLIGTIQDVQCDLPAVMKMTFVSGKISIALFSENYFAVEYSAINFTPTGELHPCQDIKGMKAKVFFYDLKGKPKEGELISVELRK
jgi:tetratricopeptide (TPR) repeat protein